MTALRTCAAALLCAAVMFSPAHAGTRVYLMRGMLGLSPGLDAVAAMLRAGGAVVMVGDAGERTAFEADAARHPRADIVFGGHSLGAYEATVAAAALAAKGVRVRVVGIDPLFTGAAIDPRIAAVNVYGQGWPMPGAHNHFVASANGHVGYVADPRVQARVVAAILGRP